MPRKQSAISTSEAYKKTSRILRSIRKERKQHALDKRFYDTDNLRSLFGNRWCRWFILLGARARGKSYAVMEYYLKQYFKYGRVFYWIRISDVEAKLLLNNNAAKLIEPLLRGKYINGKYKLETNAEAVYLRDLDENGEKIKGDEHKHLLCYVMSLSQAANLKGNALYDAENDDFRNICLDEFNRLPSQRRLFPIVTTLGTLVENLVRTQKGNMRIVCIANNTTSCSELLAQFNIIPEEFKLYKLRKRHCIIQNIANSEEYDKDRQDSALADLVGIEDSDITSVIPIDKSLVKPKKVKLCKPTAVIKFSRKREDWYTIYDGKYVCKYNKETIKNVIAMKRYIDDIYMDELRNSVIAMYDARALQFKDLKTFLTFENKLFDIKK